MIYVFLLWVVMIIFIVLFLRGAKKHEELTCHKCAEKNTCKYAYDPYNTNGDCLAEK